MINNKQLKPNSMNMSYFISNFQESMLQIDDA